MSDDDICGSTETSSGEPCQWSPGESCPYHDTDDPPDTGRPTKLNYERQERIAQLLEEGHSIGAAARSSGITVPTFFNWMSRGEQQEEGIYADFFNRITRARGHGEQQYVDAITQIAKENGDADTLLSLLKSRYPDAWGDAETGKSDDENVHIHFEADETTTVE